MEARMEARAVSKYVRVSPRKARAVVDLIRGRSCEEALQILKFTPRATAGDVAKTISSAMANAVQNHKMNKDNLYIAEAFVNQGPTMKRFRARAMGRATRIRKRTSLVTIVLREFEEE